MIGQVAAARVASEPEFGYSSPQPPIWAAAAMRRATADTAQTESVREEDMAELPPVAKKPKRVFEV